MSIPYKYKIYWFEDNDTWLDSEKDKLLEAFDNIEVEINPHKNADNIDQIDDNTEIDLILMDFNLFNIKGNEIIVALRDKNVLCKIVFYSNDATFADALEEKHGVFATARGNVGNELVKILKEHQIIIENVSTLRGKFITGAVDLDEQMNDIICLYLNSPKGDFLKENIIQKEFFNTMNKYKVVTNIGDEQLKKLEEKIASLDDGEEKESVKREKEKLIQTRTVLKKYDPEIIQIRNTLAHSKHDFDLNGNHVFVNRAKKNEIILINENWIRLKLKHLTTHSVNLDRFKSLI